MLSPAIVFYDVVLAVHVIAVVVAFGVTFAYPVIESQVKQRAPRALPEWHRITAFLDGKFVSPAAGIALVAGVYLASDRDLFDRVWVQVPFTALIVILGTVGAYFTPQSRQLAALAERDVAAAAADGPVTWSAEYQALSKRVAAVGGVIGFLILLSIFMMVAKPGGYA